MRSVSIIFAFGTGVAVSLACGDSATGTCVSSGGIVDSCKPDFTRGECDEWDDLMVNGASWSFSRKSCPKRGFPVECSEDATHVRSESDC